MRQPSPADVYPGDRLLPACGYYLWRFPRGILTADLDYVPEDTASYRTVFIQSFREWGIHHGVSSMGIDELIWPSGDDLYDDLKLVCLMWQAQKNI